MSESRAPWPSSQDAAAAIVIAQLVADPARGSALVPVLTPKARDHSWAVPDVPVPAPAGDLTAYLSVPAGPGP